MSVSTHFQDLILNHALRGQNFAVTWYVALHTQPVPTPANESALGRQPITWAVGHSNAGEVQFPMVVTPFNAVSVGFWDGPTNGNFLTGGGLSTTVNLVGGQRPVITVGGVQLEMPTV